MFRWFKSHVAFFDGHALYIHWPVSVCIARRSLSMKLGKPHWRQILPKPKPFDHEAFRAQIAGYRAQDEGMGG